MSSDSDDDGLSSSLALDDSSVVDLSLDSELSDLHLSSDLLESSLSLHA